MKHSFYLAIVLLLLLVACATVPHKKTFEPTWESLEFNYRCPDWFRDAKFGIWAHWGPQCQPEQGDWYAHYMYDPSHRDYKYHVEHYGHPSEFGFKDVCNLWRAEHWEPDKLIELYKRVGAKYFVAMANHHDNFDNWHSKYQNRNSVNVGPKAGVPYDGGLTKADGTGKWWEGLDPAKLYNPHENGEPPSQQYMDNFYHRMTDLIGQHKPDLIDFDDAPLPLYRRSDVGLRVASYYYNANQQWHGGKLEAVINTKRLDEPQRKALLCDIERSLSEGIRPQPWQIETCLGYWHYQRDLFERHGYKSARQVVRLLADVVSKNGNLLLNVPLRGDGTMDEDERQILEGVAAWMAINFECIYGSRPWRVYGEGPSTEEKPEITRFGGAAEARTGKPYTSEDFRFTIKGKTLYAIAFEWPENGKLRVRSLAKASAERKIRSVRMLGVAKSLKWTQTADGLGVELPAVKPCDHACVLKIE